MPQPPLPIAHLMDRNPYEPTRASVGDRNRPPGSIAKAVAIGALIDIGGTTLMGIAASIGYSLMLSVQGLSEAEIQNAFEQAGPASTFGLLTSFLGLLMSIYAGYQCAVIANRNGYLAPGVLSAISTAIGAILSGGSYSAGLLALLSAITVAATLGGASLHINRMRNLPPG